MSIVVVFRYSIFEQVILIDLLMLLKCSESQFGLKICFGYNRNYKAMLIVVNGALDTLALVKSLDYLSPLLLEPIPYKDKIWCDISTKRNHVTKSLLQSINWEAEESGRDGRRAWRGHCLQGLDYAQGKTMAYNNWKRLVCCHVVSCYPSFFSL